MGRGWIQLASGNGYDFEGRTIFGPFDMEKDIAGPLAGEARYVSHTDRWWDVAIHSVLVARVIEKVTGNADAAAAGLMHDCHEAVIGDIPTPVAQYIDYVKVKQLKRDVHLAQYARLHLPEYLLPDDRHEDYIELADRAALFVEKQLFMAPEPRDWGLTKPGNVWMQATYEEIKRLTHSPFGPGVYTSRAQFVDEYRRLVEPHVGAE